jgi:hypothetical protein
MPSVQVKGVPPEVLAVWKRRAAGSHRSLQQYLLDHLIEEAARSTLDEVLDRASARTGDRLRLSEASSLIEAERARR